VGFIPAGDRIAHQVLRSVRHDHANIDSVHNCGESNPGEGNRGESNHWQALLTSREGNFQQHWPASPVMQELHEQPSTSRGRLVLLVGGAGKSHWSASVEEDSRENGNIKGDKRNRIVLDVAVRLQEAAQWLGSSYDLAAGNEEAEITQVDAQTIRITGQCLGEQCLGEQCLGEQCLGKQVIILEILPSPQTATAQWRVEPRNSTGTGFSLEVDASNISIPSTVRWKYAITTV